MLNVSKLTKTIGILMLVLVTMSVITSQLYAQSNEPTATPFASSNENAAGTPLPMPDEPIENYTFLPVREYQAPDLGFTFRYALADYSVRAGCTCALANSGADVLFPGLIEVAPNDSLLYGDVPQQAYRVLVAAVDVADDTELTPSLFGTGAIVQYGEVELENVEVTEVDLNGVPALRVNDVFNEVRPLAAHMVALHEGFLYEIVVELVAETTDAPLGEYTYEELLASFAFAQ